MEAKYLMIDPGNPGIVRLKDSDEALAAAAWLARGGDYTVLDIDPTEASIMLLFLSGYAQHVGDKPLAKRAALSRSRLRVHSVSYGILCRYEEANGPL